MTDVWVLQGGDCPTFGVWTHGKTTSTDQNGQFSIHGIAPDNYALFAWETLEPGAYEDSEFLRLYSTRGTSIVTR